MSESENNLARTEAWDYLSLRFDPKATKIHPDVADNVLIAWPALIEEIKPYILADGSAKVLDFGCGTGGLAFMLYDLGVSVDALDPSPGMIANAKKTSEAERITFIQGDHNDLLDGIKYKAVVSCMAFPFIENINEVAVALFNAMVSDSIFSLVTFNPGFVRINTGKNKIFSDDYNETYIHFESKQLQVFVREIEDYAAIFTNIGFKFLNSKLLPFSDQFLREYWNPQSGIDVSEPEYLQISFKKT